MNALHFILFPIYATLLYFGFVFTFESTPQAFLRKEIALHGKNFVLKILLFVRFLGLVLIALGAGLVWYIS